MDHMFLKRTRTTCVTKMRTYYIRKDKLIIMQNMVKHSEDETKNNIVQKIQIIKHEEKKKTQRIT